MRRRAGVRARPGRATNTVREPPATGGAGAPAEASVNREQRLAELARRREQSQAGGGAERTAKIHAKGCLTARERLELLLDPGSFVEVGVHVTHRSHDFGMEQKRIVGDGVVAGWG